MKQVRMQHLLLLALILAAFVLLAVTPGMAQSDRLKRGALIGGGAGLIFGGGLGGILKGAAVGGAVGTATAPGPEGRRARRGARKGALIGGGAGLVFGDGLSGALEGAIIGGSAGALYEGTR